MIFPSTIFDYITTEKLNYETKDIQVLDNDYWNMPRHIQMSLAFKHGKFVQTSNEYQIKPPFKNLALPILRLRYRAEDIDVKDILIYIEEPEKHHLSFLVKKYWEDVWIVENDFDEFLDKAKEEKIDLGGCLIKKGVGAIPEVVPLQSIAFCDQTDILGGPIGLKFNFSPAKLKAKAKQGWGDKKNGADITIDELIHLATKDKDASSRYEANKNQTPGKNIEVYIVWGSLPSAYLKGNDFETMVDQVQVVAFYQDKKEKKGVTLYKAEEKEEIFKFCTSEEIFGRALGLGGVEELYDTIIWTNFAEIAKKELLLTASKNILYTTDESYANRQKIKDLENLEVTIVKDGAVINQVPTGSPNIQLFTQYLQELEVHARELGGATDPLLGKQPPSGTPFRLQERVVFEGKGLHEYRMGKFAKFVEKVMRDWIIPQIAREITKGKKFLTTLTPDEMQFIMEKIATNRAANAQMEDIIDGKLPEDYETLTQKYRDEFLKGGNRRFMEILAGELRRVGLKVKINIAGKQKDLSMMVDKLANVARQYLVTPQLRQDPIALKLLNKIMEASGLSGLDFSDLQQMVPTQPVSTQATMPIKDLAKREVALT